MLEVHLQACKSKQIFNLIIKALVLPEFPVKAAGQHVECAILLSSCLCQLMQISGNETE